MNAIKWQILQAELSEQCQSPGSALRPYRLYGSQQLMPYGPAARSDAINRLHRLRAESW
jgi:hypothetical protein